MGGNFVKFRQDEYYQIVGDQAGEFWGAKVTFYEKYLQLRFELVLKEEGGVRDYKQNVAVVGDCQTVTFRYQNRLFSLNSEQPITDQEMKDKIEAEIRDRVVYVSDTSSIDKIWNKPDIVDVDNDYGGEPVRKKRKTEITQLFKELRF